MKLILKNIFTKLKRYWFFVFLVIFLILTIVLKFLGNRITEVVPTKPIIQEETQPLPIPTYSPEQQRKQDEYYQSLEDLTYKDQPLFDYIPFVSEKFNITYTAPLKLKVTLKIDSTAARNEVLQWIKLRGVDPASHQIEWVVSK